MGCLPTVKRRQYTTGGAGKSAILPPRRTRRPISVTQRNKTAPPFTALAAAVIILAAGTAHAAGDVEAGRAKSQTCIACHGADGNSVLPDTPHLAGQVPGYIVQTLRQFQDGRRTNPLMTGMVAPLSAQDMEDLDAYYSSLAPKLGAIAEEEEGPARAGEKIYRGGDPRFAIAACMSCHGPGGSGIPPNFPRVAGQRKDYLEKQLLLLKSGERVSEVMNPIAFRLSREQIKALALYMHGLR